MNIEYSDDHYQIVFVNDISYVLILSKDENFKGYYLKEVKFTKDEL
jgi:hypothetical protein